MRMKRSRTMMCRVKTSQHEQVSAEKKSGLRSHWLSIAGCALVAVLGAGHLYSMNRIAVQGYAIRSAEKQLAELKQENSQLRIEEAELRSLQRIEEAGQRMSMFESEQVSYIEENGSLALR